MFDSGPQDNGFAFAGLDFEKDSPLAKMLLGTGIVPGSELGYQLAKTIYSYHPLGAVLADEPITLAQSQERIISIPVLGEKRMVEQFQATWNAVGRVGATVTLHGVSSLSRVYGLASLGVGERGKDSGAPFDLNKIATEDLFFNILDPLNTSGSLVLSQDPNSPDFMKPSGNIQVNGVPWHASRVFTKMNEQPMYIDWSNPAFGFVGRSVYQRALYPMKSFLQSLITDQMVVQKAGLLIYNAVSPGSVIDNLMLKMAGWKRGQLKAGVTGQVAQIGIDEKIETLNMQNLDGAFGMARTNILKNIAAAAGMPASIVTKETLAEGFGEGSEDAKEKARFINYIREDMAPAYAFMDKIVMRKAWTVDFYKSLKATPAYADLQPYETWLHEAMSAFTAEWPNYLIEPDSEKSKNDDVKMKSAVAVCETLLPAVSDPANKAAVLMWLAENVNNSENLFASKLVLDEDAMVEGFEKTEQQTEDMLAQGGEEGETTEEKPPKPFSVAS
jgi:hypothetical protein